MIRTRAFLTIDNLDGFVSDDPLCHTYPDQDAYRRDVPSLIIEHNIYRVDIDPRAAQIASLELWLQAQPAWYEARAKANDRSVIGRDYVVAATEGAVGVCAPTLRHPGSAPPTAA